MKRYFRGRAQSFKHAFNGIAYVFLTQRNILIHTFVTLLVIFLGLWLDLDQTDWAIIVLTFSTVWVTEFFNTAVEAVVDLTSPDFHPLAKTAKDVGAAAVLIAAFFSVIVGLLVLGPPLLIRIRILF